MTSSHLGHGWHLTGCQSRLYAHCPCVCGGSRIEPLRIEPLSCGTLVPHESHEWDGQTTGNRFVCPGKPAPMKEARRG